uniref:Reverse transcriptase domain-containing protein n=1 Tax=Amphiprion ocellaris TaxID=80972 RepID=A0AAQ5YGG3_AMPOC
MENTIYKIKNPRTGQIEESREKIKECFEMFYRDLYKQPEAASEQRIEKFLNGLELSKVKDFQNEILTKPITIKEVNVAISKLKLGKSPGSDGYTGEWYKCLKSSLSTLLVRTFNWVLRTGETPPSWHEAVISVIPKENKDKQECGNYRPISVLNVDYKLFTSILARRLENILPDIINLDQTGFIQQRQTMDNIRRTLHIVDHATREKNCALIVGLDAEKAFDSVRWLFLYKLMDKFAFHSAFIKVIQSLYSKPTARIKVNGDLSDSFMLERGSRQGCPLSPLLFTLFIEPLGQLLRQSTQIKGITVAGIEHKVAMFADDVLVYLEEPEKSFNGLMILLKEFGNLSGYKLNISKTQVMTLNFTASTDLQNRYSLSWESQEIKYLGVTVTKDLTKLLQVNYEPLSLRITEDLHRWSLIPFLSLTSRVNTIKMSVLPKLLYLFRTLPIEVPEGQFGEWDKQISRFIWQGKRPRIRFGTLQLKKEQGGLALPCLKYYYYASQLIPLILWCNEEYRSKWKELEIKTVNKFPLQAVIGDRTLGLCVEESGNCWINFTLKIWNKVVNLTKIQRMLNFFRWCAFDSEFLPNGRDFTFKSWVEKGLTTYLSFTKNDVFLSFQTLQNKHDLRKNDFYRYLQVRHSFISKCNISNFSQSDKAFYKILKLAYGSLTSKMISRIYNALFTTDKSKTLYIKQKWEREADITISENQWEEVFSFQWSSTNSLFWREHCWKNVVRYFKSPIQGKYVTAPMCWRSCGSQEANHYHIFWACPKLNTYWKKIHRTLNCVFATDIPLNFENLYLGYSNYLDRRSDKKLLQALLAASKKNITKKWLTPTAPSLNGWIDIIFEIFKMEKLTYTLNLKKPEFYVIWKKWITYITPMRADFL